MGFGLPIESVFHSLLEERLNRTGGPVRYEFLNFGVAGYSLLHYASAIEHKVAPFEPDLILLAVISNDAYPPSVGYFTSPAEEGRPPAHRRSYFSSTLLAPLVQALQRRARAGRAAGEDSGGAADEPGEARVVVPLEEREELGRVLALGEEVARSSELDYVGAGFEWIATAAEAPLFCVYLTTRADDPEVAKMRAAAERCGFGFLDTAPLFEGTRRKDFWILAEDHHPNEAANEKYADALERALARGGWLSGE
jgi:hypothetical protein